MAVNNAWKFKLFAPKILILDDQIEHLQLLGQYILELFPQCKLLRANRAELALTIMREHQPDLLLSDWQLPDLSGIELLHQLKQEPCFQDIPVIICSGVMTRAEDLQEALALGAADYLRKPVDKLELYARMHSALRLGFTLRELRELNTSKDTLFSLFSEHLVEHVARIQLALLLADDLRGQDAASESKYRQQASQSTDKLYHVLEELLQWCQMRFNPSPLLVQRFAVRKLFESLQKMHPGLYLRANRELELNSDPSALQAVLAYLLSLFQERGMTSMSLKARLQDEQMMISLHLEQGPLLDEADLRAILQPQFSLQPDILLIRQVLQGLLFQERLQHLGIQLSWRQQKQQWQIELLLPVTYLA